MIGKVLSGRYDVLDRIGQGGMALVYRARDLTLNRTVAVKILRRQWAEDEELVERFNLEARAAASLDNRHVVHVYDVGSDDDVHYIVMELVHGKNLKDYLAERGPLEPREALGIIDQVAEALAEAHSRQIVHRDIKPQNILVTDDGLVKVTDFGIARAMASGTLVNTGSILGTAQYLSPEQARGKAVGPATDLYGLGVVLYEMLTGLPPFVGDSPIAVALRHVQEPIPDIRAQRPDLPPAVANLVERLLAKDPEERLQSADALRRQIAKALQNDTQSEEVAVIPKDVASAAPAPATSASRPKARRRWPWFAALGLLVLLLAGGAYAVDQWLVGPPPVRIPKVVGMELARAEHLLAGQGLKPIVIGQAPSSVIGKGRVLDETPSAGTALKPGGSVNLLVSSGPITLAMPLLVGQDRQAALATLSIQGLKASVSVVKSAAPAGLVIKQIPQQGAEVPQGTTVHLQVSNGKGASTTQVLVPNLSGMDTSSASAALNNANMVLGNVTWVYSTQSANTVIDQQPAPYSSAIPNGSVNVTLSKGVSPTSNGLPQNQSTISFAVPSGTAPNSLVKAVVTDQASNEEVYYQQVKAGQSVSFTVQWYGQAGQLVVYLNGQQQGPPTTLTPQKASSGSGNSASSGA